mmetsp:Transcript_20769/g.46995  ORF Transcript_20769/g.46995 Transcript_20769/m.46995 type:complete len:146 (-) Transcript_20769:153-590(-)
MKTAIFFLASFLALFQEPARVSAFAPLCSMVEASNDASSRLAMSRGTRLYSATSSSLVLGHVGSVRTSEGRPYGNHGKPADQLALRFSSAAGAAKEMPSKAQELREAASGVELYFYGLLAVSTVLIFTLSGEDAHVTLAAVLAGW